MRATESRVRCLAARRAARSSARGAARSCPIMPACPSAVFLMKCTSFCIAGRGCTPHKIYLYSNSKHQCTHSGAELQAGASKNSRYFSIWAASIATSPTRRRNSSSRAARSDAFTPPTLAKCSCASWAPRGGVGLALACTMAGGELWLGSMLHSVRSCLAAISRLLVHDRACQGVRDPRRPPARRTLSERACGRCGCRCGSCQRSEGGPRERTSMRRRMCCSQTAARVCGTVTAH
jgi:hypothetical protein